MIVAARLPALRPAVFAGLGILLSLVCIALYRSGLAGPLVLDDYPQLSPLLELAPLAPAEWGEFLISGSGPLGRPVAMLSFLLDSWLFGSELWAWKATNLGIHLACGACVWGLTRELALAAGQRTAAAWFGLTLAALWLLHPLQVSTVLYTVQRMTQLAALFSLAGLWCYAAGRRRQLEGRAGGAILLGGTVLCLPLAILSKESGVLLPLLALLVELFLFRGAGTAIVRRQVAIALGVMSSVPAMLAAWLLVTGDRHGIAVGAFASVADAGDRLLTQGRVLVSYAGQVLLPSLGRMGFHHDDLVLSHGLFEPSTTALAALVVIASAVAAYALRVRAPLVALGLALFLGGHALESSVLPLEPMFEHRNYLPSLGLLLAALAAFARVSLPRPAVAAIAVLVLTVLSTVTASHVARWADADLLAEYAAQVHPTSPRVLAEAAERQTVAGRYDAAIALLASSTAQGARVQAAYVRCRRDHRLADGELRALAASMRAPFASYEASGVMQLGALGLDGACAFDPGEYVELISAIERLAIRDRSNRAKLALWRAHYGWARHDKAAAFAALADATRAEPDTPVPMLLAAMWSAQAGDPAAARRHLEAARRVCDPESRRVRDLFREAEAVLAAAR